MTRLLSYSTVVFLLSAITIANTSYTIVDTAQIRCYDNTGEIEYPKARKIFFGQDAQYNGNQPSYKDNADGTITDLNTNLMWTKSPGKKLTFTQAISGATKCRMGGHSDWRLPTIKELYSLILFSGTDPDPMAEDSSSEVPFIDTNYFDFTYGSLDNDERIIDSQFVSSTVYKSTTMNGDNTVFGVNFADGRIKGYGLSSPRGEKTFYVLYVRGYNDYGKNKFVDNGDGTITDNATGLTWMKVDSGRLKAGIKKDGKLNWRQALSWAEGLKYAGKTDWRLPNAKELQSIVDYQRCPDITNSAAIDPIFESTIVENEAGQKDYGFYWTSTSHCSSSKATAGVYVAFGRSLGFMQSKTSEDKVLMDVHGAGSQRSDPKTGNPLEFKEGRGPQGDVVRIYNMVRCVRGGEATVRTDGPEVEMVAEEETKQDSKRTRPAQQSGMQGRGQGGMQGGGNRQQGGSSEGFVSRLDKDGDKKVSKSEFDGPAEIFSELDKNHDGFLTDSEAPQGPPPSGQNGPSGQGRQGGQGGQRR